MAAQMIAEASGDAKDDRSGAILSLCTEFSDAGRAARGERGTDPTESPAAAVEAARHRADVSRASSEEVLAGVEKPRRAAADAVAKQARKGGMSRDAVDEISPADFGNCGMNLDHLGASSRGDAVPLLQVALNARG